MKIIFEKKLIFKFEERPVILFEKIVEFKVIDKKSILNESVIGTFKVK